MSERASANLRPALDAAIAFSLLFGRYWRRASEAERYMSSDA
jgi:hypothetical protein